MNKILCSIIIPYYNVPCKLVNKCLLSILNQNWDGNDYEVIFINDGSPLPIDNSTQVILSRFQNKLLIEQDNGGLSCARNSGINAATGNYLFFLDPDDYWFDNKIEHLIPTLHKNEYDIIKFQSVHIFDNKESQEPKAHTFTKEFVSGCEYMSTSNIIKGACTYCYRTTFIKNNKLFMPEGIIHEDELFLTLAFFKARKCLFTQIPLYAYIRREGSIMSIKTEQQWIRSLNNLLYIIEQTILLKKDSSLTELQLKALDNRLSYLLYGYIYNLTTSCLSNIQKDYHINKLQSIGQYPLPEIGDSRMYKLMRLCSTNKIALTLFIKTVQTINNKRVKGKIY